MDALLHHQHQHQQRIQQNQNRTNDNRSFFQTASDDFISSLSDNEISALNASYLNAVASANANAANLSGGGKANNKESSQSQDDDAYSQLFPLVSSSSLSSAVAASSSSRASQGPSSSASSSSSQDEILFPTPIGGSCQVVSQVPLNQSLISQSTSLAEMFTFKDLQNNKISAACLDSLFPNLTQNRVVEADFGAPASSPLIAAAAAAACPSNSIMAFASTNNGNSSIISSLDQDQDYSMHNRSQQSTRWNERFQELILYKQEHGDCNVPYLWEKNRPLSEWVKRQRHQFKLKKESKHSALTDEREALLTNLGFVWNSRASLWDSRFQELVQYYNDYGNLKVSKRTPAHRALSVWLKRQRHACRLFLAGDQTTCMTDERMQKLLDLGVKIHKK